MARTIDSQQRPRTVTYYTPWERLPQYRVKLTKKDQKKIMNWSDEEAQTSYSAQDGTVVREARQMYLAVPSAEEHVRKLDVWVRQNCNETQQLIWAFLKENAKANKDERETLADLARRLSPDLPIYTRAGNWRPAWEVQHAQLRQEYQRLIKKLKSVI